ncbi:MAG: hypothetical protein ACFCGT_11215 [Sandaracinaceae bacterium]
MFERIVLAHGHIVERADAKARLANGMRWMCRGHGQRQLAAHAS